MNSRERAEQLFNDNINIAYKVAHNFASKISREVEEDFIQESLIGLWKACNIFDESRGLRFSTIAYSMCAGYIMKCSTHLSTRRERRVIKYSDLDVTKISTEQRISKKDEQTITVGEYLTEKDIIDEEYDNCVNIDFNDFIYSDMLDDRERMIFLLAIDDVRQTEIGEKLGLAQAHISRIILRIKKKYIEWVALGEQHEKEKESRFNENCS